MKQKAADEYIQIDQGTWAPFPGALSAGGMRRKLLHISPEAGTWTAIFECPAASSFSANIHTGPGEYFLYKGKMEVRGGAEKGGDTATAPGYGHEASGARHDHTYFPIDSAFYITFSGPIAFIQPDGTRVSLVGWGEAQGAWEAPSPVRLRHCMIRPDESLLAIRAAYGRWKIRSTTARCLPSAVRVPRQFSRVKLD